MIKARGFTLVEAIVVIVITGIIASVVAIFVARPVQGYIDSARRAVLSDMADTSLRRIGRDVRTAVPNSVRVAQIGAAPNPNYYLEFIPTNDGARYRVEQAAGVGDILDFTSILDTSFDVFDVSTVAASVNDWLVIFNTGQCSTGACLAICSNLGANAYEGCNRRKIDGVTPVGISFVATNWPLPFDSPGHRLQVVPSTGPVTYACENVGISGSGDGTGTLTRYTNYVTGLGNWNSPAASQPKPPATGTSSLLADAVSACTITYVPSTGVTQRDGLVVLRLTLTRANESVTLYHEIHVDNQP